MLTHDVEVLVVGLGPVGSITALYLARNGIKVAAIEAGTVGSSDLRASTWHPPTIEILDGLGVADVLLAQGLKAPAYHYRDRQTNEVFSFDMTELSDRTRFPYRIQCEQHIIAHDLAKRLEQEPNATVRYNHRMLYLEQDDQGVTAYVETPTAIEKFRARYIIGADGSSSNVRKNLDLGFPGYTYSDKFLCLSTEYPIEQAFDNLCYVNYVSDPKEWLVLLRVPKLWRVLLPAPENQTDAALLSDENKDGIFKRLLGNDTTITTKHRTIYRVHQRVCEKFAVGRVCLVGDAAHLNSPIGGFGMNSGIHDGINLSEKLIAILKKGASHNLIDLYDRQRRNVTTAFVQAQTIENTKMMREGWDTKRTDDRNRMSEMASDPIKRRAFLLKQAMFTSLEDAAAIQ